MDEVNTSLVFITQSSFVVTKNIRLNSAHYFVMKTPITRGLHQIVFNHSSDIDFQDCERKCAGKPYFLFGY